jgi:hypothetical protein
VSIALIFEIFLLSVKGKLPTPWQAKRKLASPPRRTKMIKTPCRVLITFDQKPRKTARRLTLGL